METKRERFLQYAGQIKSLGYKVYVNDVDNSSSFGNYGYIVNDRDEVGYFQLGDYGYGVSFSTKHKPCSHFGTGFGLDNWDELPTEITKEVVDRVFIHHPSWVSAFDSKYLGEIVKYTEKTLLESTWGRNIIKL